MHLSLIYARSEDHVIGREGRIPWHLPEDFKHFRRTTMGCPILMGRRTYEDHQSALPGRLNVVITRQANYRPVTGVEVASSLEVALALAAQHSERVFVIGGVSLFVEALPQASCVYETVVHTRLGIQSGDAVLPPLNLKGWSAQVLQEQAIDARHAYAFTVTRYQRPRKG